MRAPSVWLRGLLAASVVLQSIAPTTASADPIFGRLTRMVKEATYHGEEPHSCEVTAIEDLAKNIDWLEHHIDRYGSIVAKQPDIWGEARLTKHRDEYERVLFQELGNFETRINASIAQSDTAFFAQAIALSNAVSGSAPKLPEPIAATAATSASVGAIEGSGSIEIEPVIELDQLSRYAQHLHELRRVNEGDDVADSPGYSLNLVRVPVSILPGKLTRKGFGAEVTVTATPVMSDDLMPTTFRNLVVNDVVDQLGLPIVRMAERDDREVRDTVWLADSSETLEQALNRALPLYDEALRSLQPVGYEAFCRPIRHILQDDSTVEVLQNVIQALIKNNTTGQASTPPEPVPAEEKTLELIQDPRTPEVAPLPPGRQKLIDEIYQIYRTTSSRLPHNTLGSAAGQQVAAKQDVGLRLASHTHTALAEVVPGEATGDNSTTLLEQLKGLQKLLKDRNVEAISMTVAEATEQQIRSRECGDCIPVKPGLLAPTLWKIIRDTRVRTSQAVSNAAVVPTGRTRNATNPLSPSAASKILGIENLDVATRFFEQAYSGRYVRWAGSPACTDNTGKKPRECRIDLLDAQRWLRAELQSTLQFFEDDGRAAIFYDFARPESGLARAIANGRIERGDVRGVPSEASVVGFRLAFFDRLRGATPVGMTPQDRALQFDHGELERSVTDALNAAKAHSVTEALAWSVVVESAMLNQRLNDDIRRLARAKHRPDLDTGRDYSFFLPDSVLRPGAEAAHLKMEFRDAAELFQRYVEVRWPIYVFALDPREQDQNVADASARRRELQFAMSLAFVNGKIGANSLTQFAKAQEKLVQTVSLNRTAAAFAHGSNTFGWRFAPRVQALEAPGTLGALKQTVCGIHPDADIRKRQIEPGMREAVAIVVMPSFVPYVDFDVHTNWFKLSNPKNAALTMKDTMRLSRAVSSMKRSRARCARCQHLYREGELVRLFRRVDQLDAELPLQSMRVQAPYENTLGGFEMFNTGVTDLAPELVGWYGAPGIAVDDSGANAYNCGCNSGCSNGGRAVLTKTDGVTQPLPICEGEGTTVFLVGDNFSVHDTKVIAGGVCIPNAQLISRQIMRATIPSCVNTVKLVENGRENEYVSVYAATPYGVTNHLHVPVHTRATSDATKTAINTAVAAAVKTAVEGLRLAPRDVVIEPCDDDDDTIKIEAFCTDDDPENITLRLRSVPTVRYELESPDLAGHHFEFRAAVKRSSFLTPMETVSQTALAPEGLILADQIAHFLTAPREYAPSLLAAVASGLEYKNLADDGKDKLTLSFYLRPAACGGCVAPSTPLNKEIEVEVTLACPCCDATVANASSASSSSSAGSATGDCNCTQASTQAATAGGMSVAATAQAAASTDAQAMSVDQASAALTSTVSLRTPTAPTPPEPIPTYAVGGAEALPPINVNVTVEAPSSDDGEGCWSGPKANEIRTQLKECWRNVRDQIHAN